MFKDLTRRNFIKTTSMAALGLAATGLPIDNKKIFAADNCTVKTRCGTFNGFVDEQGVKTWLGIPYAKSPVGALRWHAPQPLNPSDKTSDAKKFGFMAVQSDDPLKDISDNPQSEDCLTLNIWARGEGKLKPVMVFIPGGGFVSGGSVEPIYNGSNFVSAHDVIIVTINYRLNIFGFMNFASIDSDFADSGYLGLMDQIAALTWVRDNIAEFGGDPDNVTVFGHSAGSISVMLLTVAPAAKKLFNKAIPQSGHLIFYNTPKNSARLAEMFMELSGTNKVSDLMKKSSDELKQIYEKLCGMHNALPNYMPTCDGKFLPSNPVHALKDGDARGIKFLTGTTADEWCLWSYSDKNFFKTFRTGHEKSSLALQRYKGTYTPREIYQAWLNTRPDTEENFIDYVNQLDWRVGQELAAEYQSNFDDVYYYLFSERSPIENLRSCHEMDLPFTFNLPNHILPNPAPNLVKQVQASWAAFAATGNPNNEFIPHWEKYSADNRQTMELNSNGCVCHKNLNAENLKALRHVYES